MGQMVEEAEIASSKSSFYDKFCRVLGCLSMAILVSLLIVVMLVAVAMLDAGTNLKYSEAPLNSINTFLNSTSGTSIVVGDEIMKIISPIILMIILILLFVIVSLLALEVLLLVGTSQRSRGCLWMYVLPKAKMGVQMFISAIFLREYVFASASVGVPVAIVILHFPIWITVAVLRIREVQAEVCHNARRDAV